MVDIIRPVDISENMRRPRPNSLNYLILTGFTTRGVLLLVMTLLNFSYNSRFRCSYTHTRTSSKPAPKARPKASQSTAVLTTLCASPATRTRYFQSIMDVHSMANLSVPYYLKLIFFSFSYQALLTAVQPQYSSQYKRIRAHLTQVQTVRCCSSPTPIRQLLPCHYASQHFYIQQYPQRHHLP